MYKIVFVDIDGTLRNDNQEITTRTKQSIKKLMDRGILVVIASGRPRKYTENISRETNASRYIIISNGGGIYDYQNKTVIYTNIMDKPSIIELYKIATQEDVRFMMNVGDDRVVTKLKHFDGSERKLEEPIEKFVQENDINQCVVTDTDFYKVKRAKQQAEKLKNVEIKYQSPKLIDENEKQRDTTSFDVANIESSKGNAVKILCDKLNIDLKDTIAIGDNENDVSMLKKVGLAVVVDNAQDNVKKYANRVIKSNNEEGVAEFLEELNNIN